MYSLFYYQTKTQYYNFYVNIFLPSSKSVLGKVAETEIQKLEMLECAIYIFNINTAESYKPPHIFR